MSRCRDVGTWHASTACLFGSHTLDLSSFLDGHRDRVRLLLLGGRAQGRVLLLLLDLDFMSETGRGGPKTSEGEG